MKIDIRLNLAGESLTVSSDDDPGYGSVRVTLDPSELPANLNRVNGTVAVAVGATEIATVALGDLESTDQELVAEQPCFYDFGDTVTVTSAIEINGTQVSDTATFTVPLPEKVYESWVWNTAEKKYEAPVEMPDASLSHLYDWDEESQAWVLGEE